MPHLTRETLSDYALGRLPEADLNFVAGHLDHCEVCQETLLSLHPDSDTLIVGLLGAAGEPPYAGEPQLADALAAAERLRPSSTDKSDAADPTAAARRLLERLGEYQLLDKLGEGGMGVVYAARQITLDRPAALKLLRAERVDHGESAARFLRELKAIGKLSHPNIVRAYDAREIDGHHVLVMELIEGVDLSELAAAEGILPVADACELIRQAAIGLQHAHDHGLVHRDVKPSNLMLSAGGVVKVLDLGLARLFAKSADPAADGESTDATTSWHREDDPPTERPQDLTRCRQIVGSIDYMAPEQCRDSRAVDARSDGYSLGATLFKLLTGRPPYATRHLESVEHRLAAIINPATPLTINRGDLPEGLVVLLRQMLARNPAERIQSAGEIAAALEAFAAGHDVAQYLKQTAAARLDPSAGDEVSSKKDEASVTIPAPVAPGAKRRAIRSLGPLVAAGMAAVAVMGVVILKLQTPHGQLIVEAPAEARDQVKVSVRNGDEIRVVDADNQWSVSLDEGIWDVRLNDPSGTFELDRNTATITKSETEIVRVTMKPVQAEDSSGAAAPVTLVAAPAPPAAPADEYNIYTMKYTFEDDGTLRLPNLKWMVMPQYVGAGPNGRVVDDRITLVLIDVKNSFWPIIIKLSTDEAKRIRAALKRVASKAANVQPAADVSPLECEIATKSYKVDENGRIILPAEVRWKMLPKFVAEGPGGRVMDDRPAFIVEDAKHKTRPIVVRMIPGVAKAMVQEFDKVIAEKK